MDTRVRQNELAVSVGFTSWLSQTWKGIAAAAVFVTVLLTIISWVSARPTEEKVEKIVDQRVQPFDERLRSMDDKLDLVIDMLKSRKQ